MSKIKTIIFVGFGIACAISGAIMQQPNFKHVLEVDGTKVGYAARLPSKYENGTATVKYDSLTIEDSDLTTPGISLEDRVTLKLDKGNKIESEIESNIFGKIEFDYYGAFVGYPFAYPVHHPFKEGSEEKEYLQNKFLEAKRFYDKIEDAVQPLLDEHSK